MGGDPMAASDPTVWAGIGAESNFVFRIERNGLFSFVATTQTNG